MLKKSFMYMVYASLTNVKHRKDSTLGAAVQFRRTYSLYMRQLQSSSYVGPKLG